MQASNVLGAAATPETQQEVSRMASRRRIRRLRLALVAFAGLVALALPGQAAASVKISFLSKRVTQGNDAKLSVVVHPAAVCKLSVRYGDGVRQLGVAPAYPSKGHAAWTWKVPGAAPAGLAHVKVACGRAGRASRSFIVVGWVVPARIAVDKMGFSARPSGYGSGTSVSYGVLLRNTSPNQDALNVSVLVNFVMADNHLLGTAQTSVDAIPAGTTYALGNQLNFPGAAPIVRLEVVLQIGERGRKQVLHPAFDNMHFVPQMYDQGWLGSIEGELINDQPHLTLKSVNVSAVVLNRAGDVIGGGNGYAYGTLPPGAREVLIISNGLGSIPFPDASDMVLSSVGSYDISPPA
jgi:hypothetical protein